VPTALTIVKVFNNNVVLASDPAGGQVVLTGRGLGFGARPGQPADLDKVVQTFLPSVVDGDSLGQLLADIPPEHLDLASRALDEAGVELGETPRGALVVALADHLSFAIKRQRQGITVEYPLRAEVQHLYPRELDQARRVLDHVNRHLPEPLRDAETVAVALHLVNAGFASGDLSATHQMTGVIQQAFDVVEQHFGRSFDLGGVNAARFITHLRYFFVRASDEKQLDEGRPTFGSAIREAFPEAYQCAARLRAVLELRLGTTITDDETTYLTMHVARLAADDRKDP
jgi:beta-glucoside operon transcriptional antiterminator